MIRGCGFEKERRSGGRDERLGQGGVGLLGSSITPAWQPAAKRNGHTSCMDPHPLTSLPQSPGSASTHSQAPLFCANSLCPFDRPSPSPPATCSTHGTESLLLDHAQSPTLPSLLQSRNSLSHCACSPVEFRICRVRQGLSTND